MSPFELALGNFYGVYSTLPTVKGECVGIYYGSKVAKSKATKEQLNSLFIFEFSSKILIDGYDHLEQHCHSFLPYAQDALGVPGFSNNIYPLVKNGLVYFYAKKDLSANEEYLWERDRSGEFYKLVKIFYRIQYGNKLSTCTLKHLQEISNRTRRGKVMVILKK